MLIRLYILFFGRHPLLIGLLCDDHWDVKLPLGQNLFNQVDQLL